MAVRDSKNNNRGLRIHQVAWVAILVVLVVAVAVACGSAETPIDENHAHGPQSGEGEYAGTPLDGPAFAFTLMDQREDSVSLSDFNGRVVALAFLDPNCTDVCPPPPHFTFIKHTWPWEALLPMQPSSQ
jgi:cytochrome oxidase Cu insertion factor (SCO1/SenC/PrrC family)